MGRALGLGLRVHRCQRGRWRFAVYVLLVVTSLVSVPDSGLAQSEDSSSAIPRTPWGTPDLQGIWDFRTMTPFERPESHGDVAALDEEAAAAFAQGQRDASIRRLADGLNADWIDKYDVGLSDGRTSLIVDPPTGRLPALTPTAIERRAVKRAAREALQGHESRDSIERCIIRQSAPIWVFFYNDNVQVFQTPDAVALLHEMIHEAQIIPLDDRPHLPSTIRQWQGDARGRWEGDTLVVETTNRHPRWSLPRSLGPTPEMKVIERFTLLDVDTLQYEYTVHDPETFEQPWSVVLPMKRSTGPLYEYACHEGNYSIPLILSGARAQERAADTEPR